MPNCIECGGEYNPRRFDLGFLTCLECGEEQARTVNHTIVPMHKSNYIVVRDRKTLRQLNPKRAV